MCLWHTVDISSRFRNIIHVVSILSWCIVRVTWVPNIMAQELALRKDHHATPMEMLAGTGSAESRAYCCLWLLGHSCLCCHCWQTVNAAYYRNFLEHGQHSALPCKWPCLIWSGQILYSACGHIANIVADLFRKWVWEVLEHPLYLLRMNLCNYSFFQKMKGLLFGTAWGWEMRLWVQ